MREGIFLGFDFGYKRIGVAVGQQLTQTASPLSTLKAHLGQPNWNEVEKILQHWNPQALIVGIPTTLDGKKLYTTKPAHAFAKALHERFCLPVHLVDERLTTKEANSLVFDQGGYQQLKKTPIDSIAACILLEQWFMGCAG